MTGEEIGLTPAPDGKLLPWDGVRGQQLVQSGPFHHVICQDMRHVDDITMPNTMTAALTGTVGMQEYTSCILAMAAVYWAPGIPDQDLVADDRHSAVTKIIAEKLKWVVLSCTRMPLQRRTSTKVKKSLQLVSLQRRPSVFTSSAPETNK